MSELNTAGAREFQTDTEKKLDLEQIAACSVCSNCINKDTCGILAKSREVILQCELYECCALPRPELVVEDKGEIEIDSEPEGVHLLGLCVNCDNRSSCRMSKAPGGVWHCEEYC